jgi:septin family protein
MSKLKPFAIEYRHNGRVFNMTFEAQDHEDAKRRMASAFWNGQPFEIIASGTVPKWMAKAVGL